MFRRISTKLVVAVSAAVILPFVAFAFFINVQMADRLTRHVVQQALLGLVKDIAGKIDVFVDQRHQDMAQWADSNLIRLALDNHEEERALLAKARAEGREGPAPLWDAETLYRWARGDSGQPVVSLERPYLAQETREFDRLVALKEVYDLLLLVSPKGELVTCNSLRPDGTRFERDELEAFFSRDYSDQSWFADAVAGRPAVVDHHDSPFLSNDPQADPARHYNIGFAMPVRDRSDGGPVVGVLYALVNWIHLQDLVSSSVVKDAFRGLVDEGRDPSPYAWIWQSDADTILGHPDRSLYYKSVTDFVKLPQMTEAVLASESGWGLYPEYSFQGKDKNAAFKVTSLDSGFGWVVGVGIDNDDIYATANELRTLLLGGTALVLLMAITWTLVIARRTTQPILDLQRYTRRVAEGHLDEQIRIDSNDELGDLAADFNVMTRELETQRAQLVKAEKDAAWREMARQIAHDIKNPLTPIQLSLDLLERARREDPDGYEDILERTMGLMRRQVKNLQQIAGDFYEFTGGRRANPEVVQVRDLVDEVLHLHDAWAVELGVSVQREGAGGVVMADLGKLRRVFVNLVSNALQAMPEGGQLRVDSETLGGEVRIRFWDTGVGIPEDARDHLFEPYFTTKSEGTGLGLAISKRVVEEMGGTIALESAPEGRGTVATVCLPVHPTP